MLHIVKSDVSSLSDRFAGRDANGHILQVLVRVWEGRKFQWLILRSLRSVRQADGGDLVAVHVEARDCDGAALS